MEVRFSVQCSAHHANLSPKQPHSGGLTVPVCLNSMRGDAFTRTHGPEHPRTSFHAHEKLSNNQDQKDFSQTPLGKKPTDRCEQVHALSSLVKAHK